RHHPGARLAPRQGAPLPAAAGRSGVGRLLVPDSANVAPQAAARPGLSRGDLDSRFRIRESFRARNDREPRRSRNCPTFATGHACLLAQFHPGPASRTAVRPEATSSRRPARCAGRADRRRQPAHRRERRDDTQQGQVISGHGTSTMMIGIISDTHGLLRPEARERLAGVDHIVHAGDIGGPEVIAGLRELAPTTAIRGNVDRGQWANDHPHTDWLTLGGRTIYVLHNLNELDLDPAAAGIDVVVSGHSHQPKIETVDGVLYLNPGSAGPRRFNLPIALAILELTGDALQPRIHQLTVRR